MPLVNYSHRRLCEWSPRIFLAIGLAAAWGSASIVCALPGTTNLSLLPGVTATANVSAPDATFDTPPEFAIDGNRDGNYGNNSVFYRNVNPAVSPPFFYAVDLGANSFIERVQVLRRTDADQAVFGNMRLTIFQDDGAGNPGAVSFSRDYLFPTDENFEVGTWATTDPGSTAAGGAAGGTFGRFVQLERLDDRFWVTFAEFEVIGAQQSLQFTEDDNIAAGKPVTTSSPPGFGALVTSGNDGNIDGSFGVPGYRPVYHSSLFGVGESWQVDLGSETQLDHLQLFARGDNYTTSEFKVSVLNASQAEVGSFIVANAPLTDPNPGYDHVIDTAGMVGQFIRIETTQNEFLAFSELRAFEGPGSALLGDYNGNGVVDAADYTVWRDHLGSTTSLPNDDSPGVGADDYSRWKMHFGNMAGSGAAAGQSLSLGSVPEPTSLTLCGLLLGVMVARRVLT